MKRSARARQAIYRSGILGCVRCIWQPNAICSFCGAHITRHAAPLFFTRPWRTPKGMVIEAAPGAWELAEVIFEGHLGKQAPLHPPSDGAFAQLFVQLYNSTPPSLVFQEQRRTIGKLSLEGARYTPSEQPEFGFHIDVPDSIGTMRSYLFAAATEQERLSWFVHLGSLGVRRQRFARRVSKLSTGGTEASSERIGMVSLMLERAESVVARAVDKASLVRERWQQEPQEEDEPGQRRLSVRAQRDMLEVNVAKTDKSAKYSSPGSPDEAATTSTASASTTTSESLSPRDRDLSPLAMSDLAPAPAPRTPASDPMVAPHTTDGYSPDSDGYSPRHPIAMLQRWLRGELDRGVAEGLDPPINFRGEIGDAAARIQAAARGRLMRVKYFDVIQTALVVKAARAQVEASRSRSETKAPSPPKHRSSPMPRPLSPASPLKGPSPPKMAGAMGAIAGAPAPGDHARALRAQSFNIPTQFIGNTVREHGFLRARSEASLRRQASTAERLKVLHKLAQVQAGGSTRSSFVGADGTPLPRSKYMKLAQSQHWRRCPACQHAVEHRDANGNAKCTECTMSFRWVAAENMVPVASVRQLMRETKWQYQEIAWSSGSVTTRDVARLYWLSSWTPLTKTMAVEIVLWRAAVAAPLALALPLLRLQARARNRRLMESAQETVDIDAPLTLSAPTPSLGASRLSYSLSSAHDSIDDDDEPQAIRLPGERGLPLSRSQSREATQLSREPSLAREASRGKP